MGFRLLLNDTSGGCAFGNMWKLCPCHFIKSVNCQLTIAILCENKLPVHTLEMARHYYI